MFECMFDEISQHPPTDNVKRIGCGPRRPANSIEVPGDHFHGKQRRKVLHDIEIVDVSRGKIDRSVR
jgi:hypothetical protein